MQAAYKQIIKRDLFYGPVVKYRIIIVSPCLLLCLSVYPQKRFKFVTREPHTPSVLFIMPSIQTNSGKMGRPLLGSGDTFLFDINFVEKFVIINIFCSEKNMLITTN